MPEEDLSPEELAELQRIETFNEDPDFADFGLKAETAKGMGRLTQLLEPVSQFAEIITKNAKGEFIEDITKELTARLDSQVAEIREMAEQNDREVDEALAEKVLDLQQFVTRAREDLEGSQKAENARQSDAIAGFGRELARLENALTELSTSLDERVREIATTAVNLIEGYEGDDRIDASAIKNLPVYTPPTAADMRDALETLRDDDRLDASAIKNLPQYVENRTTEIIKGRPGIHVYDGGTLVAKSPQVFNFRNNLTVTESNGTLVIDASGGSALSVSDTSTVNLTLASDTLSAAVLTQLSITSDSSGLKLSGDEASPGNSQYYGTDGSGVKGFHSFPAGGAVAFADLTGSPSDNTALATALDAKQPLDSDLTTIAGLTATTDSFMQAKGSAWAARTIAQVKTDLGLSGTNSGDQTSIVGITGTLAEFNTALTDANFATGGGTATGTNTGDQDLSGLLVKASNLSDLANAGTARTNLGLAIGTNVQAYSANLDEYAAVNPTAAGLALLDDADAAAQRVTLGLEIGVNVQAYDADLTSWAGVTRAAGFDTFAATPSSANLRALLTDETGTGVAVFGTAPTFTTNITTPAVLASANDSGALGASGTAFSDLFLASGAVVNFNAGDVTITHGANQITFAGATTGYSFGDGPLLPATNDGTALGAALTSWSDLFLASGGVINWSSSDITLTHSSDLLTLAGGNFSIGTGAVFTAGTIELGAASDTTLSRAAAGDLAVEGVSVLTTSNTKTVTNKRVQPRTSSQASAASLTPDLSSASVYYQTAQAADLTINAPTGTPVIGEVLAIYVVASAATRTITLNATYTRLDSTSLAIPSGKTALITAQYNGTAWMTLVAVQP